MLTEVALPSLQISLLTRKKNPATDAVLAGLMWDMLRKVIGGVPWLCFSSY